MRASLEARLCPLTELRACNLAEGQEVALEDGGGVGDACEAWVALI